MSVRYRPRPRLFAQEVPYTVLMCVGAAIEREYERKQREKRLPLFNWKRKAKK